MLALTVNCGTQLAASSVEWKEVGTRYVRMHDYICTYVTVMVVCTRIYICTHTVGLHYI